MCPGLWQTKVNCTAMTESNVVTKRLNRQLTERIELALVLVRIRPLLSRRIGGIFKIEQESREAKMGKKKRRMNRRRRSQEIKRTNSLLRANEGRCRN